MFDTIAEKWAAARGAGLSAPCGGWNVTTFLSRANTKCGTIIVMNEYASPLRMPLVVGGMTHLVRVMYITVGPEYTVIARGKRHSPAVDFA